MASADTPGTVLGRIAEAGVVAGLNVATAALGTGAIVAGFSLNRAGAKVTVAGSTTLENCSPPSFGRGALATVFTGTE
ncbi:MULTISPECIES: hypothetical protein [Pseudomonas]|uniref:hypothetical protein n=1 Tax=Pseudomonas TaxID=286 RepID=UPI0021152FFA|nr:MULTISPECIES: hypothetical protein [Pseudomonas]